MEIYQKCVDEKIAIKKLQIIARHLYLREKRKQRLAEALKENTDEVKK